MKALCVMSNPFQSDQTSIPREAVCIEVDADVSKQRWRNVVSKLMTDQAQCTQIGLVQVRQARISDQICSPELAESAGSHERLTNMRVRNVWMRMPSLPTFISAGDPAGSNDI